MPHPLADLSPIDRSRITPGIAHIGVGNFHRAHQAMYLDRLMRKGNDLDWGIVGIGLMPRDAAMRDALASQDYAYSLIERGGEDGAQWDVIGSLTSMLLAQESIDAVIDLLADPRIRIVSLTITEGGYVIDPDAPNSTFGVLTQALARRRNDGIAPFTIMSCDNVPHNGDVTRRTVVGFAKARDPELATWIDANVAFPNSMVDRITPATTDADRILAESLTGQSDAWPVITEPFTQWVLEDTFPTGRPRWEDVGVQIVSDVAPYELMKLRLLNASHQAMAYIGLLFDRTYVHEAVADPAISEFLSDYLAEARPTVPPVPGVDLDEYIDTLFKRFTNSHIADTLTRLATDASDRIPKFVLPALRDNLAAGRSGEQAARLIASWALWLEVTADERIIDPLRATLVAAARRRPEDPTAFITVPAVFGDLADSAVFRDAYLRSLSTLSQRLDSR